MCLFMSGDPPERIRSSSLGRSRSYRARYWAYLLDNLQKAKNEICDVCEKDQDILACKEVLLILNNYSKEFQALIDLVKLNDELEKTPAPSRPASVSWEVRKPGSLSRHSRVSPIPPRTPTPKETATIGVQTVEEKPKPLPTPVRPSSGLSTRTAQKSATSTIQQPKPTSAIRSSSHKPPVTSVPKKPSTLSVSQVRKPMVPSPTSTLRRPPPPVKQTTSSLLRRCATTMINGEPARTLSSQKPQIVPKLSESTSSLSSSTSSKSWAETVKGGSTRALSVANNGLEIKVDNDDEGWKVVHNHRFKSSVLRSPSVPEIIRKRPSVSPVNVHQRPSLSVPKDDSTLTKSLPTLNQKLAAQRNQASKPILERSHTTLSAVQRRNKENEPLSTKLTPRSTPSDRSPTAIRSAPKPATRISPTSRNVCSATATPNSRGSMNQINNRNQPNKPKETAVEKAKREKLLPNSAKKIPTVKTVTSEEIKEIVIESRQSKSESPKDRNSASSSMVLSTDSMTSDESRDDIHTKELTLLIPSAESVRSDSASEVSPRSVDKNVTADMSDTDLFTDKRMAAAIWIHEQGLSLADQVEFLDQIEQRVPGRATKVHEKLSSPRKGFTEETLRTHERRQAKAQEHRERLKEERAQNYREILRKVEEHKVALEEESKCRLQRAKEKQDKADKNREEQLRKKVQKAHDEKEKVQEIAFINTIEAQNKRHDIFEREKESDMRIQEIQKKQQLKLEEKAAREAAAEERRKAMEEEWQLKVNEILEKRADRDRKLQQQQQEKEAKRQAISKLNELVRERINAPGCTPYETKKMCSACNVLITSEVYLLSHLKSSKHQEAMLGDQESYDTLSEDIHSYSLKYIIDAPIDERHIAETESLRKHLRVIQKKRCRKLKQKIQMKSKEFEKLKQQKPTTSETKDSKTLIEKPLREITRVLSSNRDVKGVWPSESCNSLKRQLGDMERLLSKSTPKDRQLISDIASDECSSLLIEIIKLCQRSTVHIPSVIPPKFIGQTCHLMQYSLRNDDNFATELVQSNSVLMIVECLHHVLNLLVPDDNPAPPKASIGGCALSSGLLQLLHTLCDQLSVTEQQKLSDNLKARIIDILSYTVSIGVVDKVMYYFTYIQKPRDSEPQAVADVLLNGLNFVTSMVRLLKTISESEGDVEGKTTSFDATQLLSTLRRTDAMGVVALLYSTLLCQHKDDNNTPCRMSANHVEISLAACRFLNQVASASLTSFQEILGREGISLQIRHIASYLLWYCSHHTGSGEEKELLHQVLLLVGFFAVNNRDNQNVIHTGGQPTVLQLLCKLPFDYFCDNELRDIFMPTLLACCCFNEQNTLLLCEEISPLMLLTYLEEKLNENETASKSASESVRAFSKRFPASLWPRALEFLRKTG
ncbi:S phase cyclin A-associated protein in the endoplasmic reticulum [Galendromus occidentalis]|uniref:S phase cyclin A-associated protein in the endoplasmic reticulum n=1 Tax=Galendromus occidentalis TaxID=34638 RepID=A0AAJ6VZ78_9ACAR|nr:S phase cyclin A-associated protein in the endoplasmic reticulum [Galendromus occidentalis]